MSTDAPPAYASVGTEGGEGPSAPPAYAPASAPVYEPAGAPPAFNPSASPNFAPGVRPTPAVVSQPQPAIQYVDQYGNPIQMPQVSQPQPAIRYVDQYGNPVAPPSGAGVQYVDQYGNPVNMAPPQSAAANIQYVTQSRPQPVVTSAVPTAKPIVTAAAHNTAPGAKTLNKPPQTKSNCSSFVFGFIAFIVFIVGLAVDSLAIGTISAGYISASYTCGWTEIDRQSYSDMCKEEKESDATVTNWCDTATCATLMLVCMITSMISTGIGACITNTCCKVDNPHCRCSRSVYVLATITGILGIIVWSTGNEMCSDRYYDDVYDDSVSLSISWGWGASTICMLVGSILSGIAACLHCLAK